MRPDWKSIYATSCHQDDRDDELIPVTRETLRLARNALRKMNEDDYYHNNGAAEQEIVAVLASLQEGGDRGGEEGYSKPTFCVDCGLIVKSKPPAPLSASPARPGGMAVHHSQTTEDSDYDKRD